MSNNQYLQWISGPSKGQSEVIQELTQDGQTFRDVAILSGGRSVDMSEVGKKFIILPSQEFVLSPAEINAMYPETNPRQDRMREGLQNVDERPRNTKQRNEKKPAVSSFSSDLLSRAKREDSSVDVSLDMQLPTKSFFKMMNDTFDEKTVDEVLELIIQSINQEELKKKIKESIINLYGE
jgi:hypothetical protein